MKKRKTRRRRRKRKRKKVKVARRRVMRRSRTAAPGGWRTTHI